MESISKIKTDAEVDHSLVVLIQQAFFLQTFKLRGQKNHTPRRLLRVSINFNTMNESYKNHPR